MTSTKLKMIMIIVLGVISSCSEHNQTEMIPPKVEKPKTDSALKEKVVFRMLSEDYVQFSIRNISNTALMAIEIRSNKGNRKVQHIFANGYLLPDTTRFVSRKDVPTTKGQSWSIVNLSFKGQEQR